MNGLFDLADDPTAQLLVVVVGLPGSGKTTLLKNSYFPKQILKIDDFLSRASAPRRFTNSQSYSLLKDALDAGLCCAISDVRFCESELRAEIATFVAQSFPDVSLQWIFFANDPAACKERVRLRGREHSLDWELELIDRLSAVYLIPEGSVVLPVPAVEGGIEADVQ
jgi:predicted kinase